MSKVDWANLPLRDVKTLAARANVLTEAHKRRSPTSERATLAESDAIFELRYAFRRIEERR